MYSELRDFNEINWMHFVIFDGIVPNFFITILKLCHQGKTYQANDFRNHELTLS